MNQEDIDRLERLRFELKRLAFEIEVLEKRAGSVMHEIIKLTKRTDDKV